MKEGNYILTSLWKAIASLLYLCRSPAWSSWVLDFDLQSWPPFSPWLMDRPTIDACISIKQSHLWWMNMSFISRASPHEVLSFFTQQIYPSAKDWLTMEVIQSAIMTSSLINLPLAKGQPCLQFGMCTRSHTHMGAQTNVSVISRYFFLTVSGILGKFLSVETVPLQGHQWWLVDLSLVFV